MNTNSIFSQLVNSVLEDKHSDIFEIISEFKKYLDEYVKNEQTTDKDNKIENKRKYSFEYTEPLSPEEKKKIIIAKMNKHTSIMKLYDNVDCEIKFKFNDDEIFYFYWDNKLESFVTTDPNGDEYYYDYDDETLVKLENDRNDKENKDYASGVNVETTDNTEVTKSTETAYDAEDDNDTSVKRYDFDVDDDKNLAFNLKNSLSNWKKNNPDDDFAKCGDEDECDYLFCPYDAVSCFKNNIIDEQTYGTDFDESGNPFQIRFDLSYLLLDCVDYDCWNDSVNEIYHDESQNLDKFCELIKEKYNFSLASWDVIWNNEDPDVVDDIEFTLTF